MSISSSLSNAISGLTAAAKSAEIISANVSNALTDGYGRREVNRSSTSLGGTGSGVRIDGVSRSVNQHAISERRLSDAALGEQSARYEFLNRLEGALGSPDSDHSITGRIAGFEAALIEAASRPDSEPRLQSVFDAAEGLARALRDVSNSIQKERENADTEISRQISILNSGLEKIATLNHNIRVQQAAGNDALGLLDQRQQQIDKISTIVPLNQVPRADGQIALFTPGGAILLDGRAATIEFTAAGVIVPEMTIASAALSGISINGQAVESTSDGPLVGGSLAGLFAVRDELATNAQSNLDAIARDLVARFSDPSVDPTLSPTDAGLFTDAGSPFLIVDEIGLSSRISLNGLANPNTGGVWRLRDGLGSVTPGASGDSAGLVRLIDALTALSIPASGDFLGSSRSMVGLAGDFLSMVHSDLSQAESDQQFASSRVTALKNIELQAGVDTDQELQNLLLVEQAFAANARVISTLDELIQTLLRL